jgi:hypothetical protein
MNHPDLPCFAAFFVLAIVVWQFSRYLDKKSKKKSPNGDLSNPEQSPDQPSKPGCASAITATIFWIVVLAVPIFILFLIFVNVVR